MIIIKVPEIYKIRNVVRSAEMFQNGFRKLRISKKPKIIQFILRKLYIFSLKLKYKFFKKTDIPHAEFVLTTKCTLKCKDCANYIPLIKNHLTLSFDDFMSDLDILLKNTSKIHSLILLGGEPFLIKDFYKYVEYSALQKKVKNVYIFSNGTIIPDKKFIEVLKKYKKKVTFWLSNYTSNDKLKNVLKTDKIIELFKKEKINYIFEEQTKWAQSSHFKKNNRTKEENSAYYKKCLHPCVSIIDGRICACPRAVAFYQDKICEIKKDEFLNIRDRDFNSEKLCKWYERDYFSFCDYCNWLEDCAMQQVEPALQL